MKQRMNIGTVAPQGYQAMLGLEKYLHAAVPGPCA
jgi:hypothetical protein